MSSLVAGTIRTLSPVPVTSSHQRVAVFISPTEEATHRVAGDLGDAQAAQVEQRKQPAHAKVVRALAVRFFRHCLDGRLDLLPQVIIEKARNPRYRFVLALSSMDD